MSDSKILPIISIVPRLAPAVDGVGDYALNLARQLRQNFAIDTHFIVSDPTWLEEPQIEGFAVNRVDARTTPALLALIQTDRPNSSTILLHYVPHGYAKKACPFWLIQGLKAWQQQTQNAKLVTMFHELYALGVPWSSDFWLSPVQKSLAIQLAQLTDQCLTSCESYATRLYEFGAGKHQQILTLSVPSTIGEPTQVLPLAKRQPRLVVFGQTGARTRVYKKNQQLKRICQALGIQEILDIGPPTGLKLDNLIDLPIVELGFQSSSEVSNLLLEATAGLINYDPNRLAKSTIFAAYCAHGVLPISDQVSSRFSNGLTPGTHYWSPSLNTIAPSSSIEGLQPIANNARAWYQTHNQNMQAKIFAELLKS
jgi:hypothetical protein